MVGSVTNLSSSESPARRTDQLITGKTQHQLTFHSKCDVGKRADEAVLVHKGILSCCTCNGVGRLKGLTADEIFSGPGAAGRSTTTDITFG